MSELAASETQRDRSFSEIPPMSGHARGTHWLNLPNALTFSRVVLTPVFLWLIFSPQWHRQLLGILVLGIASLTDVYDGRLARKREDETSLGRFMDPLADKVLVTSALIALVARTAVSVWMVAVIVVRDLFVTGLRVHAMRRGRPLVTSKLAKLKTILQLAAIFAILGGRCLSAALVQQNVVPVGFGHDWMAGLSNGLVAVTMLVTVVSGALYLLRNKHLYRRGFQAV